MASSLVFQQLFHHTTPQALSFLLLLVLIIFFPLLVVLLLHLVITSSTSVKARPSHGTRRLPPSPPRLPVIGHLHLVGSLPHVNLRNLADKYGARDYMLIHLGSVPTLVVSSPRAAEAIMRTHDHVFASRPPFTVTTALLNGSLDVLFAAYGEHWRKARKLLTVHLLTVKKVQSSRPGREEEVRLAMAKITQAAAAPARETVDMSELLYSFSSDLMCRAVSGEFCKFDGRNRLFRELLDATAKLVGGFSLQDFFPWLSQVGVVRRATRARVGKLRRRWDDLLDKVIDEHQGRLAQRRELDDFVQLLLSQQQEYGLTTDHVKALLMDIIVGGTETSYLVLEYVMAELLQNPHVMAKLQAELRSSIRPQQKQGQEMVTEDDLANMTYLKAVIKEALRLHPPAPLLAPHLSMDDVGIDGYTVPANTPVFINAWAIGRDASVWEDAEQFKPERFIDMGSDSAVNFKGNNFQLLPFGAGRRICPGMNLANSTIEIMIGNLMYHFDWELPLGMEEKGLDMTEVLWLTLHRKEKLLLVPKMHA